MHERRETDRTSDLAARIARLTDVVASRSDETSRQLRAHLDHLSRAIGGAEAEPAAASAPGELVLSIPPKLDLIEALLTGSLGGSGAPAEAPAANPDLEALLAAAEDLPEAPLEPFEAPASEDAPAAELASVDPASSVEAEGADVDALTESVSAFFEAEEAAEAAPESEELDSALSAGAADLVSPADSADLELVADAERALETAFFDDPHADLGSVDAEKSVAQPVDAPESASETGVDGELGPDAETGVDGKLGFAAETGVDGELGFAAETGVDGELGPAGERASADELGSAREEARGLLAHFGAAPGEPLADDELDPLERLAAEAPRPQRPHARAVAALPRELAYRAMAAPFRLEADGTLHCLVSDEYEPARIQRLASILERRVTVLEVPNREVVEALEAAYGPVQGADQDALLLAISSHDGARRGGGFMRRMAGWLTGNAQD